MANQFTDRHPKVIAFTLQKGGVGKTSCVVNLAAALSTMKRTKYSRYRYKVLIIDMDVHATASHYLDAYDERRTNLYDVLTDKCLFDDIICERKYEFGRYGTCQIDIAPIDVTAARIETNWLRYENSEYLLKSALEKSKKLTEYDFVFVDCPPEGNCLLTNIYNTCDYFVLPTFAAKSSFDNISITYKQLSTLSTDLRSKTVIGTIINNFETTESSIFLRDQLINNKIYKCFKTIIPHCKRYDETEIFKTPVVFYHRNRQDIHRIYSAFTSLAKEFTERVKTLDNI